MQIPFDCQASAITIPEIFSRTVNKLGWEGLSKFRERVLSLSHDVSVNVRDLKQKGDHNKIEIALNAEGVEDRENRRAILTEAWFRDVKNLPKRLLIIVDTFEKANSEVAEWICSSFLARVPDTPQLRVLIAGQKTPEQHNIEWGDCCQHHRLSGIKEAHEWIPVVEAMERHIDYHDPIVYLAGICHAFEGKPSEIIKAIERMPVKKEAA